MLLKCSDIRGIGSARSQVCYHMLGWTGGPTRRFQFQSGEQLQPQCELVVAEQPAFCRERAVAAIKFVDFQTSMAVTLTAPTGRGGSRYMCFPT